MVRMLYDEGSDREDEILEYLERIDGLIKGLRCIRRWMILKYSWLLEMEVADTSSLEVMWMGMYSLI